MFDVDASRMAWTASIPARSRWVSTGAILSPGTAYSLSATGRWCDGYIPCDPEGYASNSRLLRFLEWTRRAHHANWFGLIGAVDSARNYLFVIGAQIIYRPSRRGELLCFANDALIAYWNDHGQVTLHIKVIQE